MPITGQDKLNEHFQKGISCHHCYDKHSKDQVRRYAERERQIELAQHRGEEHLGQPMEQTIAERRREKLRFKNTQRRIGKGKLPT